MNKWSKTIVSTRLSATGQIGELQIGFNGSIQDIAPVLKTFHKRYPNIGRILKQMTSQEQINTLNKKQLDLARVTIPVKDERIVTFPVITLPFQLALYESHPLVSKEKIFINDLKNESFIITNK